MFEISIVIPVYKVEKYLQECLDSVFAQSCDDFEVILVDDGSPDSCGDICDKCRELHPDRVTVIHQANMGLGGARNTGIADSHGEYIFFLDSDDTLSPDAVETVRDKIKATGADMIMCPVNIISDGQCSVRPLSVYSDGVLSPEDRKELLICSPEAPLRITKREIFEKGSVEFPSRAWFEDLRTVPKLTTLCKKIAFLEKPVYNYYQRDNSIMNSADPGRILEIIDAIDDLTEWFSDAGLFEKMHDELEFLCADHFQFATVRLIKAHAPKNLTDTLIAYIKGMYGNYKSNKYYKALPPARKLVMLLAEHGLYKTAGLLLR